jgi:hypothetical protein
MIKNSLKSCALLDWPKEKPLFKYMKKEHVDKLFCTGEIHLGTLYDFRNQEQHGLQRGDADEGKKVIYDSIDNVTIEDPSQNNPLNIFQRRFITIGDEAKNIQLKDIEFSLPQNSVDCYIYCMSTEFNEHLYHEFKAETCVKIKSPSKFVKSISIALRNKNNPHFIYHLSPVWYGQRSQKYGKHNEYHPSIIKTKNYKNQKEVRAIWIPEHPQYNNIKLQPMNINLQIKHINRFCEVFHSSK